MCLIFVSIRQHPRYKLIIASNRDEFYNRKTAAAEFWKDAPQILGGRDLEAGGTWMAVTLRGRISLVTNFRDLKNLKIAAPSRGHLVSDFLQGDSQTEAYLRQVEQRGASYNGFNLLVGTPDELWYYSNYGGKPEKILPGLHGLSNHLLDTPWPKVKRGKERFMPILQEPVIQADEVFEFLYNEEKAPDNLLPDTGVGLERERSLSSMFIKSPGYGTRCSTLLLVDQQNRVQFSERIYDLKTFVHQTQNFEFKIASE